MSTDFQAESVLVSSDFGDWRLGNSDLSCPTQRKENLGDLISSISIGEAVSSSGGEAAKPSSSKGPEVTSTITSLTSWYSEGSPSWERLVEVLCHRRLVSPGEEFVLWDLWWRASSESLFSWPCSRPSAIDKVTWLEEDITVGREKGDAVRLDEWAVLSRVQWPGETAFVSKLGKYLLPWSGSEKLIRFWASLVFDFLEKLWISFAWDRFRLPCGVS